MIERRAQWAIEEWRRFPSMGYGQMVAAISKHFEVGITGSEQTIKRAYEIIKANSGGFVDRIFDMYMHIADEQLAHGERGEARRTLDSVRAHLGISAPARIEHSGIVGVQHAEANFDDMDDVELDAMLRRVARQRGGELTASDNIFGTTSLPVDAKLH